MYSLRSESNVTGMWVGFFSAAGIPADVGATYALTFAENRIQRDMLLDLNKEYLRDMGITRMGDVIAILRHAKQVHESAARDRVLSTASTAAPPAAHPPAARVPVAAVAGRLTAAAKTASPASRILEHYTRNAGASPPPAKRKLQDSGGGDDCKKTRLIRFANADPAGGPASKHTVFARLGGSEPAAPPAPPAPPAPAAPADRPVFSRLGARAAAAVTPAPPAPPAPRDALEYEGILKAPLKKVVTVTATRDRRRIAVGSMRADEAPPSVRDKLARAKSVKFSSTVEYKEIAAAAAPRPAPRPATRAAAVFNTPARRLAMPAPAPAPAAAAGGAPGVKARLGSKGINNITITRNVFHRLGV